MDCTKQNNQLDDKSVESLIEQAKACYQSSQISLAYNYFVEVLMLDPQNSEALHYTEMLKMVMNFEYRENYNV